MIPILNAIQIRDWDQFTISNEPVSSIDLMERAATIFTKHLIGRNNFESVSIFCGVGNNGGDGLVIARLLHGFGFKVNVYIVHFNENKSADFITNFNRLPKEIRPVDLTENNLNFQIEDDIIIDGIFGSGLNKPLVGWLGELIDTINQQDRKIISIDIPSGLFADKNDLSNQPHIIQANTTYTFQIPKYAFFFQENSMFVGKFHVLDIGLNDKFNPQTNEFLFTKRDVQLKRRNSFDHKGNSGKTLIIAGHKYYGAAILCVCAAYKSGSGYVYLKTTKDAFIPVLNHCPEVLLIDNIDNLNSQKFSSIAIGPGIGKNQYSLELLKWTLLQNIPLVIDADGINLISENQELLNVLPKNSILTPHIIELDRLIGESKNSDERLQKQLEFSKKYQIVIVQKGAFSKITFPDGKLVINSSGNSNLATAGTGDILAGMIASFLSQGYESSKAALNAVFLHGYAADSYLKRVGEFGMTASDVIKELPKILNEF